VLRAVLFDLDGTLLDLDLDTFLRRYFAALRDATGELAGADRADELMDAVQAATGAMMRPHPGHTNRDVFYADFLARTGIDLEEDWEVFERFYRDVFPGLGGASGPAPGARDALETALDLGLSVAIATNPIFPRAAVEERLAWAGLRDLDIPVLTTYEIMTACKPLPGYFLQTADLVGVAASACLMVGDDRALDLPAADVGMRTFYVGSSADAPADYRGTLEELVGLLPRLVSENAG